MAQFNYMNLADTAGRGVQDRQAEEMNALTMDARRQQMDQQAQVFDDKTRYENTRYGAGAATYLLQVMEQNPERVPEIALQLNEEMKRRGMVRPDFQLSKTPTREEVEVMRDKFMTALGGQQRSTSNVTKTWVNPETMTMWGMRQSGEPFDTGVPAQQYGLRPIETSEGTVLVDLSAYSGGPVGGPIRGTDPESMRQREAEDVAAVEGAKVDVKTRDEYLKREQANRATFEAYAVARDGLLAGLAQTDTGYWAGKIPPITEGQQIAEGGVAAMAPVLKQLFRAAGEGVFTDRDQQLLLDMVPTRDDLEGARLVKMEMIDKLVRAKLNMDEIEILVRARNVIQQGAPREKVEARLEGMGIDPRKL